jgi:hypothetical protein
VGASFSVSAPGGVVGGVPCGYTLTYAHSITDRCRQPRSYSLGGEGPGVMLWAKSRRPRYRLDVVPGPCHRTVRRELAPVGLLLPLLSVWTKVGEGGGQVTSLWQARSGSVP